jgi:glycerophosphoryl diester phosphodiesterase
MQCFKWLILLFYLSFIGCQRVEYFPDNPIVVEHTIFLAHHSGGDLDKPNTLKAAKYGFENLPGIECDIEMGLNGSLWLDHSAYLPACGSFKETLYADASDNQIIELDTCLGNEINFYRLDSVFMYMSKNAPDKLISLDVKAWKPSNVLTENIISQMNKLAQAIINLTLKYNLSNRVMVESETGDFLYYIRSHSTGIETYLSTLGDFELGVSRAINGHFSGISFKYQFKEEISKEHIDMIHRKGLKIHLWTLNDTNIIKEALLMKPDFIQTDNIIFAKQLIK